MPNTILIPVAMDQETLVAGKIDVARRNLAEGGRIVLLTVLEQIPAFAAEMVSVKTENHLTQKILAKLEAVAAGASDIECRVATGKAGMAIVACAREISADLIIVGAHHPSAMDYFLGSTASRVTRRAECSVYVMR